MSAFETTIRLQLDKYSPAEAQKKHVSIARAGIAKFLAKQSVHPDISLYVDGHIAPDESQVKPFGVIEYRFTRMKEIVMFALAEARRISPVKTGRYRDAWFAIMDGTEVAVDAIPARATVMIADDQPYARKIHVGARGFEMHRGIVEKVRQAVQRKYGALVTTNIQFITLEGGWVLRKGLRRIHEGRRYGGIRNDAGAGTEITYPALEIMPRDVGR